MPGCGRRWLTVPVWLTFLLLLLDATPPAASASGTPAATPGASHRVVASPTALVRLAPDILAGDSHVSQILTFSDIAGQLAAVGVAPPATNAALRDYLSATAPLVFPHDLANSGLDPAWREAFGFDVLQIDQSLEFGVPPSQATLLRGRFDKRELRAAWQRTGYRAIAVDLPGATVVSLHEDPVIDVDSPITRLALSSMNNAAILPDGTLAFAGSLRLLRAVLAVVAGTWPSLADRPAVATLLAAAPPDLVSATLVDGTALQGTAPIDAFANPTPPDPGTVMTAVAALRQMPPVGMALIGVTAGGPPRSPGAASSTPMPAAPGQPRSRVWLALLMANQAAAATAAPIVLERLETGRSAATGEPFATYFPAAERQVRTLAQQPVLVVDLGLSDDTPPNLWYNMYARRDLGFVAW